MQLLKTNRHGVWVLFFANVTDAGETNPAQFRHPVAVSFEHVPLIVTLSPALVAGTNGTVHDPDIEITP